MKLLHFCVAFVLFIVGEPQLTELNVEDYIRIVLAYYRFRHVHILSHFTCFCNSDNARVSLALSEANIQSRFIGDWQGIQLIDTPNQTIQGFIVDKNCKPIETIFMRDDHGIIFKNNNFWLFIDNDASVDINESIERYKWEFNEFDAMPISELFIAKRTQNDTITWKLFDAYKLNHGYDIEINENGMIEESDGYELAITGTDFLSARRLNLRGVIVTCGLVLAYPERFTYVEDPTNNHVDVFSKASFRLGKNLLENLNITCHMRQADSYGWPHNGTFDGAVGLFQKKKIQMTTHGVNMRMERLKYVEFGGDIFTPRTPLIFRQPPLSAVANIFVLPLATSVWVCIFIFMLVVFVIMMFQLRHPILKKLSITTFDVATFIWGAVCQQGTHLEIPTTSGRFVVLTTFFATLALFTSYSASIVALLQSPSNFITSLDDLIASPLKVGMHQAGYARYIVNQNYSGVKEVYAKKVAPQGEKGWIYDPFVGVERVRTELFAFQVDSPSAYKAISKTYTESEKCSLSELQMIVLPTTTILLERNSGYKELIRERIKWYKEIGLMKVDELKWIPKKPDCEGGRRGFMTVGIEEIKPAAILLLIGYGLSILLLGFEVVYKMNVERIQRKNKIKKQITIKNARKKKKDKK